jgi:hypothetical protein
MYREATRALSWGSEWGLDGKKKGCWMVLENVVCGEESWLAYVCEGGRTLKERTL